MTLHFAPAGFVLLRAMQVVIGGLAIAYLGALYAIGVGSSREWVVIWFVIATYLIGVGFLELSIRQLRGA